MRSLSCLTFVDYWVWFWRCCYLYCDSWTSICHCTGVYWALSFKWLGPVYTILFSYVNNMEIFRFCLPFTLKLSFPASKDKNFIRKYYTVYTMPFSFRFRTKTRKCKWGLRLRPLLHCYGSLLVSIKKWSVSIYTGTKNCHLYVVRIAIGPFSTVIRRTAPHMLRIAKKSFRQVIRSSVNGAWDDCQ